MLTMLWEEWIAVYVLLQDQPDSLCDDDAFCEASFAIFVNVPH
jgi:hypothetical protein